MQRNNTPVLLITIVLGVLALGATAFFLLRSPAAPPPAPVNAVVPTPTPSARWVAARDIPPRTVVTPAMLRQDFASGAAPSDAISSISQIKGQLTSEPIYAGETVRSASFTPGLVRQVPANIPIPNGYRGVAIWVDPDQTAAGLVDVGDRIDVVATHRLSYEKGPRQTVSGATNFTAGRTIGTNLLVLAVDRSIKAPAPTPTPVPGAPPAAAGPPPPPTPPPPPAAPGTRTRVLVAATPEIAERLIAANDQGTLHVTIRNPIDGDAGAVPEAREYPSRLVTAPPQSTGGGGGGNSNRGGGGGSAPAMPPMGRMPQLPNITGTESSGVPNAPAPVTGPDGSNMTPPSTGTPVTGTPATQEPPSKEITVIRGTEKTRVIVPQR